MLIPKEVTSILAKLRSAGFEAHIVGGCVRDFLLQKEPQDWDIATSATPEQIKNIFPQSFYENNFLTVTVMTGLKKIPEIEVTTYRSEAKYSDKRHPDQVRHAKTLEEDVARRDFTINAMAMDMDGKITDLFNGQGDLHNNVIKTVGNADERFFEDALRMLRAVRFAATLGFNIEKETAAAIKKNSRWLEAVSKERIRDELVKIIMSSGASHGIELLRAHGLLTYIMPELLESYGVAQNKHHIYDCYEHALKALQYAASKNYSLEVRLAALLHDIGKPRVKAGQGKESTFHGHEVVGAKMAFQILRRLKFPNSNTEKIVTLVKWHMFYYNVDEVSESSVRRLVRNVGSENMEDLLRVREADRIGSGVPKAEPYKLRHLKYVIDKVSKDPISVGMLKVNGKDVMDILKIPPGPKVGQILDGLLGMALDDPKKNTRAILTKEITQLGGLSEKELASLAEKSKAEKFEAQKREDEKTKSKYWVK